MILRGCRIQVPSHPPEFTTNPWNQLTVAILSASGTVSLTNVRNALKTQFGIPGGDEGGLQIVLRIHSMRFWSEIVPQNSTNSLGHVTVRFMDLIQSNSSTAAEQPVLEEYRDYPDQVRRSAVGFVWPLAQQSQAFAGATSQILCRFAAAGVCTIYVRLWWRPLQGALPTVQENIRPREENSEDFLGGFETLRLEDLETDKMRV